jgi:GT2 family glycosyltransferase
LDKRFIEIVLRGFRIDKRIGMVSGRILRPDGKIIDSTGLFLSPWRTFKERGYGIKDRGQFEKEGYIFGVNGAVVFYHRDMLEEIKVNSEYFDSDFRFFMKT